MSNDVGEKGIRSDVEHMKEHLATLLAVVTTTLNHDQAASIQATDEAVAVHMVKMIIEGIEKKHKH
jgi:hypothetical protein